MNWVTAYCSDQRPSRFEPTADEWRVLEQSLQRWGGSTSWMRLARLGDVARTDQ